jgi:N-acetylgalactosamine kinase
MVENPRSIVQETAVIILCAGKGTRMGRADLAKVCFEIDGVPAINRTIQTFKRLKFQKFFIVVGSLAEQVMETVSKEEPEAVFVMQSPQQGTGDAAKKAAGVLERIGHSGPVLVSLGDKYLESAAIEALVDGFVRQQADLALATIPKTPATEGSGGRVFIGTGGQILGIIEKPDLGRAAIVDELRRVMARHGTIESSRVQEICKEHISSPKKLATAHPELTALAAKFETISREQLKPVLDSDKYGIVIDGKAYTASQVEAACKGVNPSLYMFKAEAFYRGVAMIDNNNAQKEYYLTDVVKHLGSVLGGDGVSRYRIRAVHFADPNLIQGFNSPSELLAIQDFVRRNKGEATSSEGLSHKPVLNARQYRTVRQWLEKMKAGGPAMRRCFEAIYGKHPQLHEEKRKTLTTVLKCYGKNYGFDAPVVIVRAPGRINLMGRHVDHRGGYNNFLAIDRETIAVAGLREDDVVRAVNCEPQKFKSQEFGISELIGRFAWSDWVNFVNSDWVRNMLHSSQGDWVNYIKAAMLRLQHKYTDLKIRGMNIALTGNVPMAAGLSSSSTIVVATLQAGIALNNLELTSQQFIDLCGEGEWFVGSRGGAGDHAAIYLGQRGKIAQVGYLPFHVEKIVDAPAGYQVVIANSHIQAKKSATARHMFNSRIAAYNLGLALLKQRAPEVAGAIEYVRDISPQKLGCRVSDIYRLLMKVPEKMTRRDFALMLSKENRGLMDVNFASHDEPPYYYVRGVLLFGAAEIMRSKMCMDLFEAGDVAGFGRFMRISHDGDRVARAVSGGRYEQFEPDYSDAKLHQLIKGLESEDPAKVTAAQLYMQPGGYACSTPQIDAMVDIACSVEGVAGAQIAGAGLGGCIMMLVRKEQVDELRKALVKNYYRPAGLEPAVFNCITVEGAGVLEF